MGVTVDLSIWSLDAPADPSCLSADETARAERFVYDKHRDAYIAARVGLRTRLAQVVACAPADIAFTYGPQGKPSLPGGPFFNLSHAGGIACLAVHEGIDLGVDIEAFRTVDDGLAERFFSASEVAELQALPGAQQQTGFFRCWTRKEAVIKALGGGLSIPLDAFDVTLASASATLTRLEPAYGHAVDWTLHPFEIGADIVGCVAAKTNGAPLKIRLKDAPEGLDFRA